MSVRKSVEEGKGNCSPGIAPPSYLMVKEGGRTICLSGLLKVSILVLYTVLMNEIMTDIYTTTCLHIM